MCYLLLLVSLIYSSNCNLIFPILVPIIPDYLFSYQLNTSNKDNSRLGLKSLSPLQEKYKVLENDNGPLGALLASKAFVQLAFTPFIGYLTETTGCCIPLLLGSCNMLLAALCTQSDIINNY